jgi:hypothetical protein
MTRIAITLAIASIVTSIRARTEALYLSYCEMRM